MEINPQLANWIELPGTDIATQFRDAFFSESNPLELPDKMLVKKYKNRVEVLHHVAFNHPIPIVRTKACIILSRSSNGFNPEQKEFFINSQSEIQKWTLARPDWVIDTLRKLIASDWKNIRYTITPRWCIAILNCFAENGEDNERVIANSITMMYYIVFYGPVRNREYKADDTFINSMLRINQSLTKELRLVVLTTLEEIKSLSGFTNIAQVWKMIIEKDLTDLEQVQWFISKHFPEMDVTQNKSFEDR